MVKITKPNYLAQAKQLSKIETERLLSRMRNKMDRRLEKGKLSQLEALAIQLELEDEQLKEWRKVVQKLKIHEAEKKAKEMDKAKALVKAKAPAKAKAPVMGKVQPVK